MFSIREKKLRFKVSISLGIFPFSSESSYFHYHFSYGFVYGVVPFIYHSIDSKKLHLFYNTILKRKILFSNFFYEGKKEFEIVRFFSLSPFSKEFFSLFLNRFDPYPSKTYLVS